MSGLKCTGEVPGDLQIIERAGRRGLRDVHEGTDPQGVRRPIVRKQLDQREDGEVEIT